MNPRMMIALLGAAMCCLAGGAAAEAQQATDDPHLDTRVSIRYENASAMEVLSALARAGNATQIRVPDKIERLLPVTVTLTNVTLRTALDAVCENAGCRWRVVRSDAAPGQYVLAVDVASPDDPVTSIPKKVSLAMSKAPLLSVFRALAASIKVSLIVETDLPESGVSTWSLQDADLTGVLKLLCEIGNCSWQLNEKNRTLRVFARPGGTEGRRYFPTTRRGSRLSPELKLGPTSTRLPCLAHVAYPPYLPYLATSLTVPAASRALRIDMSSASGTGVNSPDRKSRISNTVLC